MNDFALKFSLFQSYYPHIAQLADWLLKSSALLVLAFALTSFLHRRSARARCWIWRLTFVGLACILLLRFGPSALDSLRPQVKAVYDSDTALAFTQEATSLRMMRGQEEIHRIVEERREERQKAGPPPPWDTEAEMPPISIEDYRPEPWARVEAALPWIWATGAFGGLLFITLRTIAGLVWLRRRSSPADDRIASLAGRVAERMGVKSRWAVRISDGVSSPVLFGFVRPLIHLPPTAADWDTAKLEAVFIHEFAHWLRRDFWWLQFARITLALFWWNPLLRLAFSRMNAEAEEAADDMVVLVTDRGAAYAQALVEIAAAAPRADTHLGVSMLGYRSLERRIRRVLQDNRWRGKFGRLAAVAIVLAVLAFTGVSSVYVAMGSPAGEESAKPTKALTPEQKKIAERIIANTKLRLEALRYTHVKLESQLSEDRSGKYVQAPVLEKLEAWNDLWTNIHRAEYRPNVSPWDDSESPYFIADQNDFCDGRNSYYFRPEEINEDLRPLPSARAMYVDYLGVTPAKELIRHLETLILAGSSESDTWSRTFAETEWLGQKAIKIQETFSPDGKLNQQRTFVVLPESGDLIGYWAMSYSSAPTQPAEWTAEGVAQLPSGGPYFASRYSFVNWSEGVKRMKSTVITKLEALKSLPENIAEIPKPPDLQYISTSGQPEQPAQLDITCMDPLTGAAISDVNVTVRINKLPPQKFRTGAKETLGIPLPKEEITYLSVSALKSGSAGRQISWTKYESPLKIPSSFVIKMPVGSPVRGRVVNEAGQPIADATVYLLLNGGPRSWRVFGDRYAYPKRETTTDANGEWSLPDFPENLDGLLYRVSAPGYKATTDGGIADFRQSSGLSYASLRDGTATITLGQGIQLAGEITNQTGQPLAKCRLTIGTDIHGSNCPVAESNAKGEYKLVGLSPGKTWITVEAPGHQPTAREIELPLASPLNFSLQPGKVVRGRVTQPDGKPCAGLNVGVDKWNKLRTLTFSTQTDGDGNFIWNGAPDSPVEFVFGACQNREFLSGLWLSPQEGVQKIVMKPALKVSGKVVDARTGQPIKEFTVTLGRRFSSTEVYWEKAQVATFLKGSFDWQTNRIGEKYVLRIEAPGYRKFETGDFTTEQQEVTEMVKLQSE